IIIRLITIVVVIALLASAASLLLRVRPAAPEGTPEIDEKYKTPQYLAGKTMNILVIGIDTDSELEGEEKRTVSMTDVIMLINFDRESKQATVLQIPRDVYVGEIVPYGKINGLYQWGITDKKPTDSDQVIGIEPLVQVINEQFKLTVDNYVLITMEGFRNAVDLIGGVEIILGEDEEPVDFEGHFVINKGSNILNGNAAEVFVRYRNYEHADIDRLRMQERFMEALMRRLFELSSSELISMTMKISDYIISDLDLAKMIAILTEVKQLKMESIKVIRVPGEPVPNYGLYGVNVFSVHKKQLADMLNQFMRPYQDDVTEAELGVIEIQNTTDDFVDSGTVLGKHDG
ncbi:MAG: LCP family protein, partial [Oscillospiraceae bacterium]|nr:LCP family protein [Oscillospiraceae bacterium]